MSVEETLDLLQHLNILEKHRIQSFKSWPFDDESSCSKLKMAQAGFYWTGSKQEPDTATCFVCNKTLDGWERTDEPWKEHAKHAPQCVFVKSARPESQLTVKEFLELFGIVIKNNILRNVEQEKARLRAAAEKSLQRFHESRVL